MMTIPPQLPPLRGPSTSPLWLRVIGRTLGPLLAVLVGTSIVLGGAWLMGGNVH
jgi:hypothetical protein